MEHGNETQKLSHISVLNQAHDHVGLRPVRAWFLKIVSMWMSVCVHFCVFTCVCVCVFLCVCPPLRLLISSGVMLHYMGIYSFCMATKVLIINGRGLGIGMRHIH